jgi:hypothetical protein
MVLGPTHGTVQLAVFIGRCRVLAEQMQQELTPSDGNIKDPTAYYYYQNECGDRGEVLLDDLSNIVTGSEQLSGAVIDFLFHAATAKDEDKAVVEGLGSTTTIEPERTLQDEASTDTTEKAASNCSNLQCVFHAGRGHAAVKAPDLRKVFFIPYDNLDALRDRESEPGFVQRVITRMKRVYTAEIEEASTLIALGSGNYHYTTSVLRASPGAPTIDHWDCRWRYRGEKSEHNPEGIRRRLCPLLGALKPCGKLRQ